MITKKTDNITFRTGKETKDALLKLANSRKWSLSLLIEDIVQEWLNVNTATDEEK